MASSKENQFVLTPLTFKEGKSNSFDRTSDSDVTEKYDPLVFCRTCASMDTCLVPIFTGEGLDYSLYTKIEKYLPIQVTENDDLPIHLCYHCASTLIAWDSLIVGCVEAERKLTLLKNSSAENENEVEIVEDVADVADKNEESDEEELIPINVLEKPRVIKSKSDSVQEKNERALEQIEVESERRRKLSEQSRYYDDEDEGDQPRDSVKVPPQCGFIRETVLRFAKAGTGPQPVIIVPEFKKLEVEVKKPEVEESEVEESEAEESEVEEPEVEEPEVEEPEVEESEVEESEVEEPEVEEPEVGELEVDESEVEEPEVEEPEVDEPEVEEPEVEEPEVEKPEVKEPEVEESEVDEFEVDEPEAVEPEVEKPKVKEPEVEKPKVKEPKVEKPKVKEPEVGELEIDESEVDEPEVPPDGEHVCPVCETDHEDVPSLAEHLYSHLIFELMEGSDAWGNDICKVCKAKCGRTKALTDHITRHMDVEALKEIAKKKNARRKKRKKGPKKHLCDICTKSFTRKYAVKRHLATHIKEKQFACQHCGRQFGQESGLQKHVMVVHEGVRKYRCPICSEPFDTDEERKTHQKTHKDARPFQCDQCGRTFISPKQLYHHRKYHHTANGMRILCTLCDRYFSSPSVLKRHHKVIHLGLKEYQCNICSAQLTTKHYLQEHLRLHSDERPEVCTLCGKTFQVPGNLKQHLKTHEAKTQVCYVCGKEFTRRCQLLVHMNCHKGVEHPRCPLCERIFLLKEDLDKHLRKDHGIKF